MLHRNPAAKTQRKSKLTRHVSAPGYRLVVKDFETRIEEVDALDGPPDFVTTFPAGVEGYVAAHDEAIAYLEDLIADCLETLKELKDSRWMNAMELTRSSAG